jgi:hypothetical protein
MESEKRFKIQLGDKETLEKIRTDPVGLFLEGFSGEATTPTSPELFKHLSPEEKAETLWALFQEAKSFVVPARKSKETEEELVLQIGQLRALYDDKETRETYLRESKRHLQEYASINGGKERYEAIKKRIALAKSAMDANARKLLGKRGAKHREVAIVGFEAGKFDLEKSQEELEKVFTGGRELGALAEYEMLREWSRDIETQEYAWTPSRMKLRGDFEEAMFSGVPILLSGESGTGKGRFLSAIARLLTGEFPNRTRGKDTRYDKEIATQDLDKEGAFFKYGSIGEAMTGFKSTRDEQPTHQGKILFDDELNLHEQTEQSARLAFIESVRPGQKFHNPVTGKLETALPRFQYVAAVNLASAKFGNRQDMPIDVLRKFKKKINFTYLEQSENNPELFEVMLAALMDENGRIRADKKELEPLYELTDPEQRVTDGKRMTVQKRVLIGDIETEIEVDGRKEKKMAGFLWRFANALGEMNKSHERRQTVLSAKGEGQFLGKLVIDAGVVSEWMQEYNRGKNKPSLERFICNELEKEFLSKNEYENDWPLAREFLAHFGIESKRDEETDDEKEKANISILTPLDIGLLSPRVKYEVITEVEPEIEEGFRIIEGVRREFFIRPWQAPDGRTFNPGDTVTIEKNGTTHTEIVLGVDKETGGLFCGPVPKTSIRRPSKQERGGGTSPEKAKEIFKERYFGPEKLKEVYGVVLQAKDIPPITLSKKELEEAESRGERLVLRVAKLENGQPATAKNIGTLLKDKYAKAGKGKPVYALAHPEHWENNDPVFTDEVPRTGWVLESVDLLPGSKGENYISQTKLLRDHAERLGLLTPADKAEVSDVELDKLATFLAKDVIKNCKDVAEKLANMAVNKKFRRRSSEVYYDLFLTAGDPALPGFVRELENTRDWTSSRTALGHLVRVGNFDAVGVLGFRRDPDNANEHVGVSFSRSV